MKNLTINALVFIAVYSGRDAFSWFSIGRSEQITN